MVSEIQCLQTGRSSKAKEDKVVSSCFWTKLYCATVKYEDDTNAKVDRLAKSWNVPEAAARSWFQADEQLTEAVEEQFRQQGLKQARSYESSSQSETSHSDAECSRQDSLQNTIMDTMDLSPTKQQEWERQQSEDVIGTTYQNELQEGRVSTSMSWLQKNLYINPHEIFFCSRSNGKLLRIGKGSFGSVYKGVWNGELVAVKVCNQQRITERAKQQFQQEVSILHSCFHPNVVQFKGACCWKGGKRTVLVTEYMEKGDLCSALGRAASKCSWPRLGKSLALDIARGLAFLHSKNIVHFDLKSGNILLDRNNTAKIADVGLAKILTTTHGNANLATFLATADLGTFAWAAPEALLGNACDAKADIFSYGIVLYEICTAETPQGRNLRPLKVPEEAPQEVADLITSCLQYEPTARPSAQNIISLLEKLQ